MEEQKYIIAINKGPDKKFEKIELKRKDFIFKIKELFPKPKRIFLGMGGFLEIGDYSRLLDSVFIEQNSINYETLLDKTNRELSENESIPFSFFKLGVYFPDFILKDVPTYCASAIGRKARLFPGASMFIKNILSYDPLILSALPSEVGAEIIGRTGIPDKNLISTEYSKKTDERNRLVFSGGLDKFISGDRKSLEIEKQMAINNLKKSDVVYIGQGEAGVDTFSSVNSIAFNSSKVLMKRAGITLYGSSLESLLVLFNHEEKLNRYILSSLYESHLPSLVVFSEGLEKSKELLDLEIKHCRYQENILAQRIELSGESFNSVVNELYLEFGASSVNIREIRQMITKRIACYKQNSQKLVDNIHEIAKKRYKSLFLD